ncbi:MAG: hypothetical protein K2K97_06950 [Muribaculaceae bacterium]|nr:hypothetical protein [Muribaculaceae bacterium]
MREASSSTTATDTDSYASRILDMHLPYSVYNLSGIKVADSIENLSQGIYIVRQGTKTIKIAVK